MKTVYSNMMSAIALVTMVVVSPKAMSEVKFHAGFSAGQSNIDVGENDFNDGSLGNTQRIDGDVYAWDVYGEVQFNPYIRAELGFLDSGVATMDATSVGGSFWWPGPVSVDYAVGGVKIGAVGTLPVGRSESFKLLAKLGLVNWVSVVELSDSWGSVTETDGGVSLYSGLGAEYDLSRLITLRLQYEVFSVEADSDYFANGYDFDVERAGLGLMFRF